jgi:thiamine kinase-like enzyme
MNWENIPASYCHGDLSFDNILIYNNEIYFIDFLDSFINSWTIDVAKILQETRYLWSYRYKNINKILIVKLKYFEEIILDILNITDNEIITINKIIYLNIIRILPYVKDKITKDYIYNNINKIKGKI